MKKIYLIAAIFALLTGIAVYGFAGALQKAAKREYVEVVVAIAPIPERTIITTEMLSMKQIPKEMLSNTNLRDISQAVGLFSDYLIDAGEMLSVNKIHAQDDKKGGLTYYIPEGKRAFTISVDAVTGVSGFIAPGDRVDILANISIEEKVGDKTNQIPTSLIVSQNIEVLAAGNNIRVENGVNVAYTTITLALTPDESVTMNLVSANGKLRAILRSPLDKEIVDIMPKTTRIKDNIIG